MSAVQKPLHIDIPVTLADIKGAFSVAALAFEGDLPASIFTSNSSRRILLTRRPQPKSLPSFTPMPAT